MLVLHALVLHHLLLLLGGVNGGGVLLVLVLVLEEERALLLLLGKREDLELTGDLGSHALLGREEEKRVSESWWLRRI